MKPSRRSFFLGAGAAAALAVGGANDAEAFLRYSINLWTPFELASLREWWDADFGHVFESGARSTGWQGRKGTLPTAPTGNALRPTVVSTFNGTYKAVRFNGANALTATSFPNIPVGSTECTVVTVGGNSTATNNATMWGWGSNGTDTARRLRTNSNNRATIDTLGTANVATLPNVLNNYFIHVAEFGTTTLNAWQNSVASGSNPTTITTLNTPATRFRIGSSTGTTPNQLSTYDARDILVFAGLLSTLDRYRVEGFCAWRSGLQTLLPSDHPYRWGPPQIIAPLTTPFQVAVQNCGIPSALLPTAFPVTILTGVYSAANGGTMTYTTFGSSGISAAYNATFEGFTPSALNGTFPIGTVTDITNGVSFTVTGIGADPGTITVLGTVKVPRIRQKWAQLHPLGGSPWDNIVIRPKNYYMNGSGTSEVNTGNDLEVLKASISLLTPAGTQIGPTVQLKLGDAGTFTIPDGTDDMDLDTITAAMFNLDRGPANAILYIKGEIELPSVSAQQPYSSAQGLYLNATYRDLSLQYEPEFETAEDILVPGGLIIPQGRETFNAYRFSVIVAQFENPIKSYGYGATSIENGFGDISPTENITFSANAGLGLGNGYMSRALFLANIPNCRYAQGGLRWQSFSDVTKRRKDFKYLTDWWGGTVTNDLTNNRTADTIITSYLQPLWAILRAEGVQRIKWSTTFPNVGTTDYTLTLAGQTVTTPGFNGTPSQRDLFNTAMQALVGQPNGIDQWIDLTEPSQAPGNPTKWPILSYSNGVVLAAPVRSSTFTLSGPSTPGDGLVIGTGATQEFVGVVRSSTLTGGVYVTAVNSVSAYAHNPGEPVYSVSSYEGVHPTGNRHQAFAVKAAPFL